MINISNIKIKNFKSIKEMDISLLVNSAGLEKDVLLGGFKYTLNKKNGLAAYNVFFGRNSIGKSTILEALSLAMDLHNSSITTQILNVMIDEEIPLNPLGNILTVQNSRKNISEKIKTGITSGSGEYYHKFQAKMAHIIKNKYLKLAHSKDMPIEIILDFIVDHQIYQLYLMIKDSLIDSNLINISNKNAIPSEAIVEIIQQFLANSQPTAGDIVFEQYGMKFESNYSRPNVTDDVMIEGALIGIKNTIGHEKLIDLIRLADANIEDIVFTKNGNNEILNKIIVNATNIDIMSLSTGTRQFILMLWTIVAKSTIGNCLVMIDEIELSLHKELIDVLKIVMEQLFIKKNIQFIITTHSPLAVYDYTSFKQIYSITIDDDHIHHVEKLSTKFKNHQNIINRYINGELANYPDPELSRNVAGDLFD